MPLDDAKAELLKSWITNKLESASEADSDVLADYVLALVRTEEPEAAAKASAIESLKDFLGDNADTFVSDVFTAIKTQEYDPNRPKPKPPTLRRTHQLNNGSRKRSHQQFDDGDSHDSTFYGSRPLKYPRNATRGGRAAARGAADHGQFSNNGLAFEPNDTFMAFLAMHQAMGLPLPDLNNLPGVSTFDQPLGRQSCREYVAKGFCTAGASCPYDHDFEPHFPSSSWNELAGWESAIAQSRASSKRRRGSKARGAARSQRHGRAEFSQLGPYTSESNKTIVVEHMPEEHCTEDSVRDYFATFGEIEQLDLQPQRRLVVITFTTPEAARTAYRSPKAIFDNRFVKVFWYRPEGDEEGTDMVNVLDNRGQAGSSNLFEMDLNEFTERQQEAQRRLEENRLLREEAEKRKSELDERLQAIEQEQQELRATLVSKYGLKEFDKEEKGESQHAKALKAQLAELEAEALSLGLDPNVSSHAPGTYSSHRGRDGFRGRGGRRGSWRGGRATPWQPGRDRPAHHLDNRPKALTVVFQDGAYGSHEEQLRHYLFFTAAETSTLMEHPEHAGAALVAFKERWQAEEFADAVNKRRIAKVGKLSLAWYKQAGQDGFNGDAKSGEGSVMEADGPSEWVEHPPQDLDEYGDEEGELL